MSLLSKFRLPIGVITVFVVGTDLFAVSTLLPSIADDLQTGVGPVAWTVPVFSAAYLVTSPAMGRLAEHRGHRPVLLVGMLAFAVANLLTGLASSLWALVAFCVLTGAAAAAITPSLYAVTGGLAPRGQRGSGWPFSAPDCFPHWPSVHPSARCSPRWQAGGRSSYCWRRRCCC